MLLLTVCHFHAYAYALTVTRILQFSSKFEIMDSEPTSKMFRISSVWRIPHAKNQEV